MFTKKRKKSQMYHFTKAQYKRYDRNNQLQKSRLS